ncbi:MAG: hypothetical protein ABEJ31_13555 [Haloarculaceae archaeon]
MPTCPGCEQSLSYERLPAHERTCPDIHGGDRETLAQVERVERRLVAVERRLDARLRSLEAEFDRADRSKSLTPADASSR